MKSSSNTPVGAESGPGQYSLRDLLTIVFKRRALILMIMLSAVTIVMVVSLLTPRTYKVVATLLVNEARAEMPIAPTQSAQFSVNRVSEEDLNSEIEVLKSRTLIEGVVRRLEAEAPQSFESSSSWSDGLRSGASSSGIDEPRSEFDAVVQEIQIHLDVSAIPKSNVLSLSYLSTDPEWATAVVGTLTDQYLRQRADRYQSPQAVVFFEQQMNEALERLGQREQVLEKFADEASITMVEVSDGSDSLAAQKEMVMQRLSSLEASLGSAEVEFQSQSHRVSSLQSMIQNEPERLDSPSRMNQDARTEEIQRALTLLRLERDRLLQDFKPDSRHVRDIDTQIEMAENRLSQAAGDSTVSGTESNPVYLQLKSELMRAEAELEGTRARVISLRNQAAAYRTELGDLNAKAFDLETLHRDAQAAEEDYQLYRKKHEEARISAAMDREKFINVTVAQPAQTPFRPEPRGLALKLFLSVFVGMLGGIGVALGIETFLDRSFTTAEDLEKRLGMPHISSIPDGVVG